MGSLLQSKEHQIRNLNTTLTRLKMSVVGIDIGEHSTYIAVAKQGGVEIVSNDYSQRNNPTVVALGGPQRHMGVTAEIQRNLNVKNTISNFKNLLGRSYKDEYVQDSISSVGADVVELEDGGVGFKISNSVYHPEQILAMMFTKVKDIVRSSEEKDISTCVVSVPSYFTEVQIKAVKAAAKIAKVDPFQIVSSTSALAMAYGRTKSNLPIEESNSNTVVFIDCGSSSLEASMVNISRDKAIALGTSSTMATGGKYFDQALLNHFVGEIEEKYRCQIRNNSKALNKLRLGVEKIKKQMSANSNRLPLQIDSLVEDIDVNLTIDRDVFEALIKDHLSEVERTFKDLLTSTGMEKEQIHSVEIVGGSSRVPAVKDMIEKVFGKTPSSSLNADEAVAKGSCFHAASISDKFLTKSFLIKDTKKSREDIEETGISDEKISQFADIETQMVKDDIKEICRQEAKNVLEEQLYKYRAEVNGNSEELENTDEFNNLKEYFQQTEDWLYEEGEDASEGKYNEMLTAMHEKITAFQQWQTEQIKMRALDEKRKRLMDQENSDQKDSTEEDCIQESPCERLCNHNHKQEHQHNEDDGYMNFSPSYYSRHRRPRSEYRRGNTWNSPIMFQDPFTGYGSGPFGRSPFTQRSIFGW